MAKKIATENEAYTVADKFIATTEIKMCTHARAIEIGCDVNGIYKSNQLVAYEDLSKTQQLIIAPKTVTLHAYALNEVVYFVVTCPDNYLWQADRLSNANSFKKNDL